MPDAGNGFVTAVIGVISGLIAEVLLKAFVDGGLMPSSWIVFYQLLNVLAVFVFVHVTKYWGTLYLFGWWFGAGIMLYSGLLWFWEFLVYSIILSAVLISRVMRGFASSD